MWNADSLPKREVCQKFCTGASALRYSKSWQKVNAERR